MASLAWFQPSALQVIIELCSSSLLPATCSLAPQRQRLDREGRSQGQQRFQAVVSSFRWVQNRCRQSLCSHFLQKQGKYGWVKSVISFHLPLVTGDVSYSWFQCGCVQSSTCLSGYCMWDIYFQIIWKLEQEAFKSTRIINPVPQLLYQHRWSMIPDMTISGTSRMLPYEAVLRWPRLGLE